MLHSCPANGARTQGGREGADPAGTSASVSHLLPLRRSTGNSREDTRRLLQVHEPDLLRRAKVDASVGDLLGGGKEVRVDPPDRTGTRVDAEPAMRASDPFSGRGLRAIRPALYAVYGGATAAGQRYTKRQHKEEGQGGQESARSGHVAIEGDGARGAIGVAPCPSRIMASKRVLGAREKQKRGEAVWEIGPTCLRSAMSTSSSAYRYCLCSSSSAVALKNSRRSSSSCCTCQVANASFSFAGS